MNIAILGFGTIGSGVYDIIAKKFSPFLQDINVTKILIRPGKEKKLQTMTSDFEDIVNDPSIDLIVETMGGIHPAYEYIRSALSHRKHVVTANKAVIAQYMNEFITIAQANNVFLSFEASTAGGIPWIASIQKARRIDNISKFYGILNGTTNDILDSMDEKNEGFATALANAQGLGYAEADPSADIDGIDVRNKVVISAAISFNYTIDIDKFPCFGIRNISKIDVDHFKQKDLAIKLIGEARRNGDKYEAFVMPDLFHRDTIEANVKRNLNVVTLYGDTIGELKFYGQGAGKMPTANAVIQDILDIYSKKAEYTIDVSKKASFCDTLNKNKYVIRTNKEMKIPAFIKIEEQSGLFYHYTDAITIADMQILANEALNIDKNFFIMKIADF